MSILDTLGKAFEMEKIVLTVLKGKSTVDKYQ
jgi:hypothetical protein